MKTAFELASVVLLGLIAQRKRANDDADVAEGCTQSALVEVAQSGYRSATNEKEPGQCGFHDSATKAASNQHHAEGCTQSALVEVAQSGYRSATNEKEPGQCGFHDSATKAASNQHHAEGKENEAEGQEVHGGLSGLGFGQLGPVLLPVVGTKLLPRHLPVEVRLQGPAVIRRERLEVVRPRPHIAAVVVTQDSRDLCMAVACEFEDLQVGFDWFHAPSLIWLDLYVKPV